MRIELFFSLMIFAFLISSINGVTYKCASELSIKTCYLEGEENGDQVIYKAACPKGQSCVNIADIGKCMVSPSKAVIGSPCKSNTECKTDLCENGLCVSTKKIGETCTDNENCPINAICTGTPKKCTQLVEPDGICTVNEDCIVGYACYKADNNASTGLCKEMYARQISEESANGIFCVTGRALWEANNSRYCIQYSEPDATCEKKSDAADQNAYYCDPQITGIGTPGNKYAQCVQDYKGNYNCVTKRTEVLNRYISLFKEVYSTLNEDAKRSRLTDRNYLNNDNLQEAYDAYANYYEFRPEVQCAPITDDDDGNNSDLEDNGNGEENENKNDDKNGDGVFLDSTSFISSSLSVVFYFFFM